MCMKSEVSELIFNVKKGTEKALKIGMFIAIIFDLYNKKILFPKGFAFWPLFQSP